MSSSREEGTRVSGSEMYFRCLTLVILVETLNAWERPALFTVEQRETQKREVARVSSLGNGQQSW